MLETTKIATNASRPNHYVKMLLFLGQCNKKPVIERACFLDDTYVFGADGSFSNVVGDNTWLETWQDGVEEEACGAPVAPHNGTNAATFSHDQPGGNLTITGLGAYLGLPKVHNGGEDGIPCKKEI